MENKLFCKECGSELSLSSKFCHKCGTKVDIQIVNDDNFSNVDSIEVKKHDAITKIVEDLSLIKTDKENCDSDLNVECIIGNATNELKQKSPINNNSTNKKPEKQKSLLEDILVSLFLCIIISLVLGFVLFLFIGDDFASCFWVFFVATAIIFTFSTRDDRKRKKIASMSEQERKIYNEQQERKEKEAQRNLEIYRSNQAHKQPSKKQQYKTNKKNGVVTCPKCGSSSITTTNKKLSATRGATGAIIGGALTGGIGAGVGAVAGGLSSKKIYNVCMNCGHKWKP